MQKYLALTIVSALLGSSVAKQNNPSLIQQLAQAEADQPLDIIVNFEDVIFEGAARAQAPNQNNQKHATTTQTLETIETGYIGKNVISSHENNNTTFVHDSVINSQNQTIPVEFTIGYVNSTGYHIDVTKGDSNFSINKTSNAIGQDVLKSGSLSDGSHVHASSKIRTDSDGKQSVHSKDTIVSPHGKISSYVSSSSFSTNGDSKSSKSGTTASGDKTHQSSNEVKTPKGSVIINVTENTTNTIG
jgi:hypothetical protein